MLEVLQNIISTSEFQLFFKLILVSALSGLIGFEREHSSKPAGFRTHVLVGISAVLVMTCGVELATKYGNNDPSRMPAQLLSGIGFIGAGTILSNGFKVKGLTTASGLLAVTCIGMCVGAGLYWYAIIATLIVFVILKYSYLINAQLEHGMEFKFKVSTNFPKEVLDKVNELLEKYEVEIKKVRLMEPTDDELREEGYILYACRANSGFNKNKFLTEMMEIEIVKQVNEF